MIKTVECESLLHWVYREELPKRQGDVSWSTMFASASWRQGCRVDFTSSGEHMPVGAGTPHPDALLVDHVVRGLESLTLIWERAVDVIMGDLAEPVRSHPALMRMEFNPQALIVTHSKIGMRPMWDLGTLSVKPLGSQPRVMWLDEEGNESSGSKRGGYYSTGACCPIRFDPPLAEIAAARAEYHVWHQSLIHVTNLLSTLNLSEYRCAPPTASPHPWVTGEIDKRNVVTDMRANGKTINQNHNLPLIPRRSLTSLPPSRSTHSPVRFLLSPPRKSV